MFLVIFNYMSIIEVISVELYQTASYLLAIEHFQLMSDIRVQLNNLKNEGLS